MTLLERLKIFIPAFIVTTLLRLIYCTLKFERVGFEGEEANWPSGAPRIIAFWHGRQLFMPWVYVGVGKREKRKPMHVLISKHKDGRLAAKVMSLMGVDSVAGSSSSGATGAALQLLRVLRRGSHIGITPDGPKGPVKVLKVGVVKIAQASGAPVYPSAVGINKCWIFKSWDKMILPRPFSKVVLVMGRPIFVPRELTAEETETWRQRLENAINEITAQADNYYS